MFPPSGQIGNLVLLNSDLMVNDNSLSGSIPTELGRLTDVTDSKFVGLLLGARLKVGWC